MEIMNRLYKFQFYHPLPPIRTKLRSRAVSYEYHFIDDRKKRFINRIKNLCIADRVEWIHHFFPFRPYQILIR